MIVPTYAIACDELPERKDACAQHLSERGVPFAFWRGIHGKTWRIETKLEYEPGHRISPGHVGLNLGHWNLWGHLSHVLRAPNDFALVLEDDAVLPADWNAQLPKILAELDAAIPDWQFCFVGMAECEPQAWNKVMERIGGARSRLCRLCDPFGTHAYLVRKSALPILMDKMRAAERNMDQQLYKDVLRENHIIWCALLPVVVRQRTFDYDHKGKPEWPPSTIDPAEEPAAPSTFHASEAEARRLAGQTTVSEIPSPAEIAAASFLIDPFPCIYRGEHTDSSGSDGAGRSIPISVCARLDTLCHSKRASGVKGAVRTNGVEARSCEGCEYRAEMSTHETRPRLPLPEGHFNPSMIVHQGRLILATRDSWGHSKVALWHLTNTSEDWTGEWKADAIGSYAANHPQAPRLEDPRLFHVPDERTGELRLCSMFNLPDGYPPKRVQVGYVQFASDLSGVDHVEVYQSPHKNAYEKNWSPFWAEGALRWVYHTWPEHVVLSEYDTKITPNPLPWKAGVVRGGAAPVFVPRYQPEITHVNEVTNRLMCGDRTATHGIYHPLVQRDCYYHFFHGCLKRVQGSVYTLGCAVFEAVPPFRVLRQTPKPLMWPDLPAIGENVVKRYVLWPGGAVPHASAWHVAVGVDDSYSRIVRLPFAEVEAALSDVPAAETLTGIRDTPLARGTSDSERK